MPRRGSGPLPPRARAARRTRGPGGYDGASSVRRRARRSSRPSRWNGARPRGEKYSRGTFSGRRSGSRRRTETTSAPAASAFSHSVAAARPGADDRRRSTRTRAARRSARRADRRAAPQACSGLDARSRAARAGRRRARRARTRRRPRARASTRPLRTLSSQPLALAQLLDMREEVIDARVVAVADATRRAAPASAAAGPSRTASPGNDVGRQCPSLSERISRWRIAAARRRQAAAGSSSVPKTVISSGCKAAAAQGLVRREAGEPGADDRDAWHYFTEPASSPCTK